MALEFKLPTLQEGVDSATVVKVLVAVGDTVAEGDSVIEVETDKASVEVPTTVAGKVQQIHVEEGKDVSTGQVVLTLAATDEATGTTETVEVAPTPASEVPKAAAEVKTGDVPTHVAAPAEPIKEPVVPAAPVSAATPAAAAPEADELPDASAVPAAPSVRRFAREIGVDITKVPGSGPAGRISVEDVKAYSRTQSAGAQPAPTAPAVAAAPSVAAGPVTAAQPLPDFSKWGQVEREAMSGVRRTTAQHLSQAWVTIPHVTHHDKADITEMEKFRKQYGPKVQELGAKLTMTAILLKVMTAAVKVFPQFNASVDMTTNEIVYKKYYNMGVAVDTDRGLLVPVIRDTDQKSIAQIAVELGEISAKARDKKLTLDDMSGGTFTLSNLGGIGGQYFTPIVNWPEVAILGVARSRMEPVYIDGEFVPRNLLPLSLSYDHRIIDGADAARFMRWIINVLEDPLLLALEG